MQIQIVTFSLSTHKEILLTVSLKNLTRMYALTKTNFPSWHSNDRCSQKMNHYGRLLFSSEFEFVFISNLFFKNHCFHENKKKSQTIHNTIHKSN